MRSLSLIALGLATIGVYAKPTIHVTDNLEVYLSTPTDKVASVSELRVVATVKNVGDEDLEILKPGTVLDNQHPTRSFTVTKDEKEVLFTGIEVLFSTDHPSEDDLVVIPAGTTVTAEHDVSAMYDFYAAGPGTFTFDPIPRFQIIGLNDTVEVNTTRPVSITVTDEVSKRGLNLRKRATLECDDRSKRYTIGLSYLAAKAMANVAAEYIKSRHRDKLYGYYFGSSPVEDVISNFTAIADEGDPGIVLSCSDPDHKCNSGKLASRDGATIHYCHKFYGLPNHRRLCGDGISTDPDHTSTVATLSQLSIIVTHTEVYDWACLSSVDDLPEYKKIRNAANYACFAAQVYKDTQCPRH